MKKSKLFLILALVLSMAVGLGGTLAYLTDTDEAVNVMTLGNVQIKQIELQRAEGVDYNNGGELLELGELVPFQQGKALYPAYPVVGADDPYQAAKSDNEGNTELLKWGPYVTADNPTGGAGNGLWNDSKLKGVMDKFVFVENTGTSDAYFRTWFAFECPEGISIGDSAETGKHQIEINGNDHGQTHVDVNYKWEYMGEAEIDGVRYHIECATYNRNNGVLPAGEIARPSLLQVVMSHHATNEDVALLGETYEILTFTQAVQTNNFENAEQALTAAFGEATVENNPWKGEGNEPKIPALVSTAAELKTEMAKGGTVVLTEDIVLGAEDDAIEVPAGVNTTLVLNGRKISQQKAQTDVYAMIDNKGTLTITGEGTVSYADTTVYTADINYASNTIRNTGVLNIEGGVIENASSDNVRNYGYPHAIDVYEGSVTNITGGVVKSANYDSIRMFCNSVTKVTEVNISGGEIVNRITFQNPDNNYNTPGYGRLNISGGNFTTTDGVNANVRLLNFSKDFSNMKATITGGTFDKGVKTQNYTNVTVTMADWLTVKNVTINEVE